MTDRSHLPPRVFPKGNWYYLVRAEGKKRIWTKLTRIREGVAILYRKLADLAAAEVATDAMPALVTRWRKEVSEARHTKKTQADDTYLTAEISERFAEFRAADVTPPDVTAFLKPFRARPRTHNAYRSMLRELMRFAEQEGHRPPGSNPVDSVPTMTLTARDRYITDSELRRIKVAAMFGEDGLRTRSGPMLCALIDLAYLTGQRISDLLELRWSKKLATNAKGIVEAPYVDVDGLHFQPAKTARSTGARVLIEWTPRLAEVIARIRAMKRQNIRYVVTTQESQKYTYWGASTAWRRAVKRAKIADCHFHDLRAKALTDKDGREGIGAAKTMGAHSTEGQTADYIRHKTARRTKATR